MTWLFRLLPLLALAVTSAHANPSLEARGGVRFGPSTTFQRTGLGASMRWGSVHAGIHAAFGSNTELFLAEQTVEIGVWIEMSPSSKILLGWRGGHARFQMTYGPARYGVSAIVIESVAELAIAMTSSLDLRISPLTFTGYQAGIWQIALGPELGLSRSF